MRRATTAAALALAALLAPVAAQAQEIGFAADLPRTLVFVAERGEGDVATRDIVGFLREAGFPLVDPALAHTAAQRELVEAALGGDEGAAVALGRDFGAQLLLLGTADWGARPDPVDQSAVTGTAEVEVRALRLDDGEVIGSARGQGRRLEATEQAARAAAIRDATHQVLAESPLVGRIINNWGSQPWSDEGYFEADPGSVGAALERSGGTPTAPRLAILETGVAPADEDAPASRGIGVFRRGDAAPGLVNRVRLEGVVLGDVTGVEVEGVAARLEALAPALAEQLGVGSRARHFSATTLLPVSRDTLRVVATSAGGATAEALAAPRVNQRWAVIIGIGEYASDAIPDLAYAGEDAQAFYEFLRSDAAGPFPEENILFLRDGAASGQAMREALFVFLQQAAWDDLVVIYFAGHGAPDPNRPENLYLLPADAKMDALAATGFPMWDVKTALRRQIAAERVIVIADACHSGGAGEDAGANPINGSFADLFTPSRRLTLTAADADELSFEDARWGGGHGVFTYNLLEALKGGADADSNGIVTFTEAAAYVSAEVAEATDGRQNPQRTGLGDVPLALVPVASAGGK